MRASSASSHSSNEMIEDALVRWTFHQLTKNGTSDACLGQGSRSRSCIAAWASMDRHLEDLLYGD